MCGICGFVDRDLFTPSAHAVLVAMRDSLAHRGPDDEGVCIMPGVGLGSRRLSIIDLSSRGHMPMTTADKRFWITYNGEIYNFRELRRELESRGYSFRSQTDTEVVLKLYADEGPHLLNRLNGMFAFAIWDNVERRLFLARDRLGVKPLYYAVENGRLYFASEEKALFAAGVRREFNPEIWEELFCFRFVAGERTPFSGIYRLKPGHYLTWQDGKLETHRWWNLADRARELRESLPRQLDEWFQETFDNSVDLRRISDVPVGVLLSGGLDSSCVAASLSSQTDSEIASFTVRFCESGYDEGPLARQVADRCGLEPYELRISTQKLPSLLVKSTWLNDEPLVHSNDPHLLAIAEFARSRVTVLLSGEGGDELLGGYVRYRPLRHSTFLNLARPVFPRFSSVFTPNGRLRKLGRFLELGSNDDFVLFNACNLLPQTTGHHRQDGPPRFPYREEVLAEARALYPGEYMRQAMYSDQHTFLCSILDRNDRMTMGASIECRVPFLDYRLVETLAALPSAKLFSGPGTKPLLRRYAQRRLPPDVLRHRKWGFGVPWGRYFRTVPELRDQIRKLPCLALLREVPFHSDGLHSLISEFFHGADQHEALLKQLLMLAIWYQLSFGKQFTAIREVKAV
ncbi:MAG TPA: asparagine synthase (glutamine-hydrolyzing) [Pyrinomonadaceae bacterium]|nr:asparagine synthase (glutamine-hydrolyzing) [Pyrinomonadaceae bacterium]